jgi:hypothetical protein
MNMAKSQTPPVFREAAARWTEAMRSRGFSLIEDARQFLLYTRDRPGCWEVVELQLHRDRINGRVGFVVTCGSILEEIREFDGERRTDPPRGCSECARIMRLLPSESRPSESANAPTASPRPDIWWLESDLGSSEVVDRAVADFRIAETWFVAHDASDKVILELMEYLDRKETFFPHLRELSILATITGNQRLLARSTARLLEMKTFLLADAVREHLARLNTWKCDRES